MKHIFKLYGFSALICGCVFVSQLAAQDAVSLFNELLPQMTAADLTNAGDVQTMESAQQRWMEYCLQKAGAPGEEQELNKVNKLMTDALQTDQPVYTKWWLLHILQWTGTAENVDAIVPLLLSDEPRLADGSARALAQIPAPEAAAALEKVLAETNDEVLKGRIQKAIAARTLDLSIPDYTEAPRSMITASEDKFNAWMKSAAEFSDDDRARALAVIRVREDKNYHPFVIESLGSENSDVKKAAALALEKMGTVEDLPIMLDLLFSYDTNLMKNIFFGFAADGVDAELVRALQKETDANRFQLITELLALRNAQGVIDDILVFAAKPDCPNRLALLTAAESLATVKEIPTFVDVMIQIPTGADRDRAEQIIARLSAGDASVVMKKLDDQNQAILFPLLGRIGDEKSLNILYEGLKKNKTAGLAVRALCNWPNAKVADSLMSIVENRNIPESLRNQALRAYVRVMSLPDDQIGIEISLADKLVNLQKAMTLATRLEEKRFVIERLAAVRDIATLKYVMTFLSDADLADAARKTIVELAHHDFLRKQDPELFKKALDTVLETSEDQGLKDRARGYRDAIQ